MRAYRCHLIERFRLILLALFLPALLGAGASATLAQTYQDNIPSLAGGWFQNVSSLAVGGVYYTTFNTQSVVSSTATWAVNLPQAGQYQVYVSSIPTLNVPRTTNARYVLTTALGNQGVSGVDQNFLGWKLIGTFPMNAGVNLVQLTDLTGEPQLSHSVLANAVRWVLGSGGPPPPPAAPVITGYVDFNGLPITSAPPGSPVTILGSNFGFSGSVAFAGFSAPVVAWSPNAIRVLTPLTGNYPTVGPVTVTTGGQTAVGPTFTIAGTGSTPPPTPTPTPTPPAAGDWPMLMHDARLTGLADSSTDPRGLTSWSLPLGGRPGLSPVVRNGIAYIGTEAGGVVAIDTATRTQRWNQPLGVAVRSALAVGSQVVVVSARGLYGLSPADGSVLWTRSDIVANDDVSPTLVGDTIYIGARAPGSAAPTMYALSATTGAVVWSAPLPAGYEARGTAAAFTDIGLLFVSLGPPAASVGPGVGPSAVAALRLTDGGLAWPSLAVFPASPPPVGLSVGWVSYVGSLAVIQPAVFLAAGQSVSALNGYTGALLWSRVLPESSLQGPPVLSTAAQQGSTLFVGASSGRVYALDSTTGADAAGGLLAPVAPITGTLALAGSYLFVPTSAALVAVDVTTGANIWSNPMAAGSGVAVAGGQPYVATADGQFIGFAASSTTPPPTTGGHDLAITGIQVQPIVSRSADAEVLVQLVNRGTTTETYHIYLRVRPGDVLINDYIDAIGPGQTKTVGFIWPTFQMGNDGAKTLVAQVVIQGQDDSNPGDNAATQTVVVGP
jgi:outer membrane protein assembly factor BamB